MDVNWSTINAISDMHEDQNTLHLSLYSTFIYESVIQTVNVKYDREEAKVFSLENCLRNLQQNVLSWHEEGEVGQDKITKYSIDLVYFIFE